MTENSIKWNFARQFERHHDHSGNPEKENIPTSFQKRIWKKQVQVFLYKSVIRINETRITVLLGHPIVEKGQRPEENQVSKTSSSCSREMSLESTLGNFFNANSRASSADLPETQRVSSDRYF